MIHGIMLHKQLILLQYFATCCIFKGIASDQSETKDRKMERLQYRLILYRIPQLAKYRFALCLESIQINMLSYVE